MKLTCTIVTQDWEALIPALTAGKFDVIMASMFITDKRLEVINFSPGLVLLQLGDLLAHLFLAAAQEVGNLWGRLAVLADGTNS
jgi:hypothetical protein